MQTFDPDVIKVQIRNLEIKEDGAATYDAETFIEEEVAVAYFTLPRRLAWGLKALHDEYGAVGFEYNFDTNQRELGLIIKAKE